MNKLIFVPAAFASVLFVASAIACPAEKYEVHQIALDANGVVTRSEQQQVPAPDFDESQKTVWATVVVDKIKLELGDEVKLNAAPDMQDATVHLAVKRNAQKADKDGIFHTTYTVREIWTSGWGGTAPTEKVSLVTVKSNYLGAGKRSHACGSVVVKKVPNTTVPALPRGN